MSFTSMKISNNYAGFGRLQSKGANNFFLTAFGFDFYIHQFTIGMNYQQPLMQKHNNSTSYSSPRFSTTLFYNFD